MTRYLTFLVVSVLLSSATLAETKQTISGKLVFGCDGNEEFMGKKGFTFLEKGKNSDDMGYPTNIFGAKGAKVVAKDSSGKLVGLTKSDASGEFSMAVKTDSFYEIDLTFKEFDHNEAMMSEDVEGMTYRFGQCDWDTVKNVW